MHFRRLLRRMLEADDRINLTSVWTLLVALVVTLLVLGTLLATSASADVRTGDSDEIYQKPTAIIELPHDPKYQRAHPGTRRVLQALKILLQDGDDTFGIHAVYDDLLRPPRVITKIPDGFRLSGLLISGRDLFSVHLSFKRKGSQVGAILQELDVSRHGGNGETGAGVQVKQGREGIPRKLEEIFRDTLENSPRWNVETARRLCGKEPRKHNSFSFYCRVVDGDDTPLLLQIEETHGAAIVLPLQSDGE